MNGKEVHRGILRLIGVLTYFIGTYLIIFLIALPPIFSAILSILLAGLLIIPGVIFFKKGAHEIIELKGQKLGDTHYYIKILYNINKFTFYEFFSEPGSTSPMSKRIFNSKEEAQVYIDSKFQKYIETKVS